MRTNRILILLLSFVLLGACRTETEINAGEKNILVKSEDVLTTEILTPEEQEMLSPDEVLQRLKRGNKDFANGNLTVRNNTERVRKASLGQYPKAVVLSCLDSRVPVEDVFHSGIGNLFVIRIAGNIINQDIIGSLEYACKVSGAKLILVLGHEYCGAITAAINNFKLGSITGLLDKIQPSVHSAKSSFAGEKTSSNPAFVETVCMENIIQGVRSIRSLSPILNELEANGTIRILGGVYDMNTGIVDFFE